MNTSWCSLKKVLVTFLNAQDKSECFPPLHIVILKIKNKVRFNLKCFIASHKCWPLPLTAYWYTLMKSQSYSCPFLRCSNKNVLCFWGVKRQRIKNGEQKISSCDMHGITEKKTILNWKFISSSFMMKFLCKLSPFGNMFENISSLVFVVWNAVWTFSGNDIMFFKKFYSGYQRIEYVAKKSTEWQKIICYQ